MQVLDQGEWAARQERHTARAQALLAGHRRRRAAGEPHPVEDFLFTYYSYSPSRLSRWHPGVSALLTGDGAQEFLSRRHYTSRPVPEDAARASGQRTGVGVDREGFRADRSRAIDFVSRLLRATQDRPAFLGCFGLHEWAMVYRQSPEQQRHARVPLRLGRAETDEVVASHRIRCSHFDAFRFFTPPARPLNERQPARDTQVEMDQPGCLHATMDLYKWAYKLAPATSGELVLDCFTLARDVRELDMRASPYDLRAYGYEPVAIETPEGKAQYVAAQRQFARRASELRGRLLEVCAALEHTEASETNWEVAS
ncbi:3-methyladenine DNA glycosylase [Spiractinospora alimapuensis]|uniref:3-methyladenine DNA glycosylase n=1 Tax=Spiractinospora alimapuensis TaxID=2820884 RepID=UPI00374473C9